MSKYTHDIIVIGGGAAGLTAASGASQLGLKTALFEKDRTGGDCLYYGCVPSKTLLKSASLYHQAGLFPAYGLPELVRGNVDLKAVMSRVHDVISKIEKHDAVERFEGLGAEVYKGSPRFISPHEIILDGKIFSAAAIVISTGSAPFIPEIKGLAETGYITNREVFSLDKLPDSLVVIGGGPIGVELGQAFLRLGSKVTIINSSSHLLSKEDDDMAQVIEDQLIKEGAVIINNAKAQLAAVSSSSSLSSGSGGMKEVTYTQTDNPGKIFKAEGELILAAAGREGNTAGLDLEKAGVETGKNFIPVNQKLQTRQKHIYAIGDVNGSHLFTHVAGAEGSFVIKKAVLHLPGNFSYNNVPWCTYSDPELASIGYNEKRAKEAGISFETVISYLDDIDRAQAEQRTEGKIKILIDKKERVIGTQIAGAGAGDLILPSLYAVTRKFRLMEIMSPIYPYPTMGEIQKKAASVYYGARFFNSKTRKILKKIFGYRGRGPVIE